MCSPVWESDIDRNWYNTGWRDKSWGVLLKLYILGKQEIDESTCRLRSPETSQSLFLCCGGHRQVRLCTFLTDGSPLPWPSVLLFHSLSMLPPCVSKAAQTCPSPDGVFKWPSRCRHVSGGKSCSAPQPNSWKTCWPCSWVSRATRSQEVNLRGSLKFQDCRTWLGVSGKEEEQWKPSPSPSCLWDAFDRPAHMLQSCDLMSTLQLQPMSHPLGRKVGKEDRCAWTFLWWSNFHLSDVAVCRASSLERRSEPASFWQNKLPAPWQVYPLRDWNSTWGTFMTTSWSHVLLS